MEETNDTSVAADELDAADFETDEQPAAEEQEKPETQKPAKETPAQRAKREVEEDEYEQLMQAREMLAHFNEEMEKNPKAFFARASKFSPEIRAAMEEAMAEEFMQQIEDAKLTPEQKELRELKAKLQAQEDEKKRSEEEQMEAMVAEEEDFVSGAIQQAMELSNAPRNAFVAQIALRGVEIATQHGIDATPEMLADYINTRVGVMFTSHLRGLDGDKLIAALGDDGMKVLKAALIAKKGKPQGTVTQGKPRQEAKSGPKTAMDFLTRKEQKPAAKKSTFELLKRGTFARDDE